MKRHQRKPVLDINSDSSRKKQNSKYHQNTETVFKQDNGVPTNPLSNLLEQYNSDSDDDPEKHGPAGSSQRLDKKVDDFMKEIQYINPNKSLDNDASEVEREKCPESLWQECFDESTGYPYYWHVETNQVTWEIPKDLELSRKKKASDSVGSPRPAFDPQRSFPSKTYPEEQANIPEGMIPKEVVARNRNRQVNTASTLKKPPDNKTKNLNDSKDEDANDGRIEMITSFGSDGSDESDKEDNHDNHDEEDNSSSTVDKKSANLRKKKHKRNQKIGPRLPDNNNCDSAANGHKEQEEEKEEKVEDDEEEEEEEEVSDEKSNESLGRQDATGDDKECKFSLVPGYADDSDNEDDPANNKTPRASTLFPILNYTEKDVASYSLTREKPEVQSVDSVDSTSADDNKQQAEEPPVNKVNKFLENSEVPAAKRYQRKQRIAFDVIPSKSRNNEAGENSNSNSSQNFNKSDLVRSNDERLGFGFPKQPSTPDANKAPASSVEESSSTDLPADKNEPGINFVRGETLNGPPLVDNEEKIDESDRIKTKNETETILEKLKFLSEGCQGASAVQIMTIQLQTLLGAWEAGDLKNRYLENWLTGTSRELCRLEKAAAPSGWDCQWDRSHKRYYYRNESNGEVRWNYPDVIGGAEEMELCTTPPPPMEQDDEEDFHSEKLSNVLEAPAVAGGCGEKDDAKTHEIIHQEIQSDKETPSEGQKDKNTDPPLPPPPPQISSPSPPPPPKIYPDDLKQGKKRKANEFIASSSINSKKEKTNTTEADQALRVEETVKNIQQNLSHALAGPGHAEPLPPGVDSPEISYPLAGAPLEQTVIFANPHQQANASLYAAAALQDPGNVSIIGHHHPALLQNQLVHYPAYHQHLHNQAILAAANRLTGQETVQFVLDFPRIYTNTQVIAKPPVKTSNETMGSALDSFYSDIASLERQPVEAKPIEASPINAPNTNEEPQQPVLLAPSLSTETEKINNDAALKEKDKKKKKAKIGVSKKQKQVSSMVAKWQKAQNYEDTN